MRQTPWTVAPPLRRAGGERGNAASGHTHCRAHPPLSATNTRGDDVKYSSEPFTPLPARTRLPLTIVNAASDMRDTEGTRRSRADTGGGRTQPPDFGPFLEKAPAARAAKNVARTSPALARVASPHQHAPAASCAAAATPSLLCERQSPRGANADLLLFAAGSAAAAVLIKSAAQRHRRLAAKRASSKQ